MTDIEEMAVNEFEGSVKRLATSTHVVSYWTDTMMLMDSEMTELFFDSKEKAEAFEKKISCIEQRPMVLDLSREEVSRIYPLQEEEDSVNAE